jgi:tetratricopeptide (TPR) repeat protein
MSNKPTGWTDSEYADYQYQLGLGAASNEDYEYAINHFTEAINTVPNHVDALYNRAVCYANCNQTQTALDEMEALNNKLVARGQSSHEVALSISQYYYDLKRFGHCIEWCKCVLQFAGHSSNGEALLRIARAYIELKRPYKAYMYISMYMAQPNAQNLQYCYMLRSNCYSQEKRYDFALAEMQKARELGFGEHIDKAIQELKAKLAEQQVDFPQNSIRSVEESAFSRD